MRLFKKNKIQNILYFPTKWHP